MDAHFGRLHGAGRVVIGCSTPSLLDWSLLSSLLNKFLLTLVPLDLLLKGVIQCDYFLQIRDMRYYHLDPDA